MRIRQPDNLAVLVLTTLVVGGSRQLWWRLLPLELRALGASDGQVSLVFTAALLIGPAQLLGGYISDRWGRRHAISLPTLLLAPALLLSVTAVNWLWLAVSVWLIMFLANVQSPAFTALTAESSPPQGTGRAFGYLSVTLSSAQILGPAAGALLIPWLGISGLIWINLACALVGGLARLLLLREGTQAADSSPQAGASHGQPLIQRHTLRLIAIHSLAMLVLSLGQDGPFFALHAADVFGLNANQVNVLFALGGLGGTAAALIGSPLIDRWGGRRLAAGLTLSGAGLALLWSYTGAGAAFTAAWMMSQLGGIGLSAWTSITIAREIRGRALGMIGAAASIIGAAGPPAAALMQNRLTESTGLAEHAPFWLAVGIAGVLCWVLLRTPDSQPGGTASLQEP